MDTIIILLPILSAFISAVAACFSAFSAYKSSKNSSISIEFQTRQLIIEAKMRFLKYDGKNEKLYNFLVEELNNAYDEISSKYLDNKLDKKTFERIYKSEIMSCVDNFKPDIKKYKSLYKTYDKLKSK